MIMKKGIAKIVSILTLAAAMTVASAGGDIVSRAETVILPTDASGTQVEKNDSCIIDYSDTASGYINVKYIENTDKTIKAQVIKDGTGMKYCL